MLLRLVVLIFPLIADVQAQSRELLLPTSPTNRILEQLDQRQKQIQTIQEKIWDKNPTASKTDLSELLLDLYRLLSKKLGLNLEGQLETSLEETSLGFQTAPKEFDPSQGPTLISCPREGSGNSLSSSGFDSIIDTSKDPTVFTDSKGKILRANEPFKLLYNYSEHFTQSITHFTNNEGRHTIEKALKEARENFNTLKENTEIILDSVKLLVPFQINPEDQKPILVEIIALINRGDLFFTIQLSSQTLSESNSRSEWSFFSTQELSKIQAKTLTLKGTAVFIFGFESNRFALNMIKEAAESYEATVQLFEIQNVLEIPMQIYFSKSDIIFLPSSLTEDEINLFDVFFSKIEVSYYFIDLFSGNCFEETRSRLEKYLDQRLEKPEEIEANRYSAPDPKPAKPAKSENTSGTVGCCQIM